MAFPLHAGVCGRCLRLLGLPVLAALLFACSAPEPEPEIDPEDELEVLYYEHLVRGGKSTIRDTVETVLDTPEEWAAFEAQLDLLLPVAPVDFEQTMLVAIAIPVDVGGHILEIDTIEYDPGREVIVTYIQTIPGGNCLEVLADTAPFVVTAARRVPEPVRFVRQIEYADCRPGA